MRIRKSLILSILFALLFISAQAATIVRLGPEYFPDPTKGKPVSNGSIYVGIVDLDPEIVANQKQVSVRQESGTIIDISQPVSTTAGGVPEYNGSAVTLLVDGDYSLKILDSSGSQVYYIPQISGDNALYLSEMSCDLAQAVTDIGSTVSTVIIDCDTIIADGTTVTIPSTLYLNIINGGSVDGVAGGGTETLDYASTPINGNYRVYGDNLDVTGLKFSQAEWWGYSSSATSLNNRTYFNKALQALVSGGSLYISPGTVESDLTAGGFVVPVNKIKIYGAGEASKMSIINSGTQDVFNTNFIDAVIFEQFEILGDGAATAGAGIKVTQSSWRVKINNVRITGLYNGIEAQGWYVTIEDNYIGCSNYGITSDNALLTGGASGALELYIKKNFISQGVVGIYLNAVRSVTVENNAIGATSGNGITSTGNSRGNVFSGNHLENCGNDGLAVIGNSAAMVSGNRSFDSGRYNIYYYLNTAGSILSNRTLNGKRIDVSDDNARMTIGGPTIAVDTPIFNAADNVGGVITVSQDGFPTLTSTILSFTSTTAVKLVDNAAASYTNADVRFYAAPNLYAIYIKEPQGSVPVIVGGNNELVTYDTVLTDEVVNLNTIGVKDGIVYADIVGDVTGDIIGKIQTAAANSVSYSRRIRFTAAAAAVEAVDFFSFSGDSTPGSGFCGTIYVSANSNTGGEESTQISSFVSVEDAVDVVEIDRKDKGTTAGITVSATMTDINTIKFTVTTDNTWASNPAVTVMVVGVTSDTITVLDL